MLEQGRARVWCRGGVRDCSLRVNSSTALQQHRSLRKLHASCNVQVAHVQRARRMIPDDCDDAEHYDDDGGGNLRVACCFGIWSLGESEALNAGHEHLLQPATGCRYLPHSAGAPYQGPQQSRPGGAPAPAPLTSFNTAQYYVKGGIAAGTNACLPISLTSTTRLHSHITCTEHAFT